MMHRLCYPWIVYPLVFIQNLCTYVSTRSRFAVGLAMPLDCGSYNTILKWLVDQGTLTGPINCPDGNIGVAFDNIQVLKNTYAISVNSKMESSVITNIIWITLIINVSSMTPHTFPNRDCSNWKQSIKFNYLKIHFSRNQTLNITINCTMHLQIYYLACFKSRDQTILANMQTSLTKRSKETRRV